MQGAIVSGGKSAGDGWLNESFLMRFRQSITQSRRSDFIALRWLLIREP